MTFSIPFVYPHQQQLRHNFWSGSLLNKCKVFKYSHIKYVVWTEKSVSSNLELIIVNGTTEYDPKTSLYKLHKNENRWKNHKIFSALHLAKIVTTRKYHFISCECYWSEHFVSHITRFTENEALLYRFSKKTLRIYTH